MTGRRIGRTPKYVQGTDGQDIVGLSLWKTKGIYYATGTSPKVTFGKDYLTAIQRFRAWQAKQGRAKVTLFEKRPPSEAVRKSWAELGETVTEVNYGHVIPEDVFFAYLRDHLSDRVWLRKATQITGYPLDRLFDLPAVGKPLALSEALTNYQNKLKPISEGETKQVNLAWQDFVEGMEASDLADITKPKIQEWVRGLFKRYSPKMAKNRVYRVKTVLRYNLKQEHDVANCQRVLRWLSAEELPSATLLNPEPISKDDFHKLLDAAKGTLWESMLLVAMNAAYYAIDLVRLPVKSVNLQDGTIVFIRQKKNTPRVCVLWKRSIESLKSVLAGREDRQFVFETYRRGAWSRGGFANEFAKLRAKASLPDTLMFNSIRDGALTACGHLESQAKLLAGHRVAGELDAYNLRNPHKVTEACEAIEQAYFGNGRPQKRGKK